MAYDYYKHVLEDMESALRANTFLTIDIKKESLRMVDSWADELKEFYTDSLKKGGEPFRASDEEATEYLEDNESLIREVLHRQYELIGLDAYLDLTPSAIDFLIRLYIAETSLLAQKITIDYWFANRKEND